MRGFEKKSQSHRRALPRPASRKLRVERLERRELLCVNVAPAVPLEPTDCDQYMLEWINRARADGGAEAVRDGLSGLQEGPPSINGEAWTIQNSVQPLSWNTSLKDAASAHSLALNNADQFFLGVSPHTFGGTTPSQRIATAGYVSGPYTGPSTSPTGYFPGGENVYEALKSPVVGYTDAQLTTAVVNANVGLFRDLDPTPTAGRGHRNTMMLGAFKEFGVGITVGTDNSINPGNPPANWDSVYIVQEYGIPAAGINFLTGVAYNETVLNDGFYTPGEGQSGVTITATPVGGGGASMTTTFASGGYSLQLADGQYTITASGSADSRVVTISGENVKLDLVDGQMVAPRQPAGGLYNNGKFYLDTTDNIKWDKVSGGDTFSNFGIASIAATATPVVGDWDGDGTDDLGLYNNDKFYLDTTGNGRWDRVSGGDTFSNFGIASIAATATPVVGDWDGDGTDDLGLFNNGKFYLDTTGNGRWDRVLGGDTFSNFGIASIAATATPVVGDWDGNGIDDLGLYNNDKFYLDTTGNGRWDRVLGGDTFRVFGLASIAATAAPVVGDWDGNGIDDLGLYNNDKIYLDTTGNGQWDRVSGGDTFSNFGLASIGATAAPVVGQWGFSAPLLAAGNLAGEDVQERLSTEALTPIVDQALAWWAASGATQTQLERLANVQVRIADLPAARLGEARGTTIMLDIDAAGYGWFVDATPGANEEFHESAAHGLVADPGGPAEGRMDLLTAVLHELGHVIGHGDLDDLLSDDVMSGWLAVGVRRVE